MSFGTQYSVYADDIHSPSFHHMRYHQLGQEEGRFHIYREDLERYVKMFPI